MDTFCMYRPLMQNLIDSCISEAIETVDGMYEYLSPDEINNITFAHYRESITRSACDIMGIQLDPDYGGDDAINQTLMKAIGERVSATVKIGAFVDKK